MAESKRRRVLLTGASSGIGRALARELGERGYRLALSARRGELLERTAAEVRQAGGEAPRTLVADLSQRGAAADLGAAAVEALGGVDMLINNAGTVCHGLQWVLGDRDEGREVLETNFWSPLALTRALAPAMLERGEGTIVNVTSLVQVSPFPALSHYCASKAALALATETLRLEAERAGIQVTEVLLGTVDTPGSTEQRLLPGGAEWLERSRLGTAEAAARAIASGIERGRDRILYPRALGIAYALPALSRRYARRMGKNVDVSDTSVRRGGSSGDERNRSLREEWESRASRA